MTQIPPPLAHCRAPVIFSPSELAVGDQCLLRCLLGSVRDVPTLGAHPAAELGRVLHRLLEMAARGQVVRSGTSAEDAQRALDALLDAADRRLETTWPNDPPRLRQILSPLAWRRKLRVILDLAEKYLSNRLPRLPTYAARMSLSLQDLPDGTWAEVTIEAPAMRLRGRADLIQRTGRDLVIRDLKTGRVLTNEGDILPHVERQLRLYGAMTHSLWPTARVALVVDDGVERQVGFSEVDESEVLAWLERVLASLPQDTDIETYTIATPGDACRGCGHRHVCPAYRQQAPAFWRTENAVQMPLDVWGELVAIESPDKQTANITIVDAAGRTAKVFGLAAFRTAGIRQGDTVWLFGLHTQERCGRPGFWRHPYNFFEISNDGEPTRAWTLEMFTESSGS